MAEEAEAEAAHVEALRRDCLLDWVSGAWHCRGRRAHRQARDEWTTIKCLAALGSGSLPARGSVVARAAFHPPLPTYLEASS